MQNVHPLREMLHHEVHARPYERMNAPLLLSHVALEGNAGDAERAPAAVTGRSGSWQTGRTITPGVARSKRHGSSGANPSPRSLS